MQTSIQRLMSVKYGHMGIKIYSFKIRKILEILLKLNPTLVVSWSSVIFHWESCIKNQQLLSTCGTWSDVLFKFEGFVGAFIYYNLSWCIEGQIQLDTLGMPK